MHVCVRIYLRECVYILTQKSETPTQARSVDRKVGRGFGSYQTVVMVITLMYMTHIFIPGCTESERDRRGEERRGEKKTR